MTVEFKQAGIFSRPFLFQEMSFVIAQRMQLPVSLSMLRFFFDFHQAGKHDVDTVGLEFADAETAYLEAVEAAQEMWSELLKDRIDPRCCHFEVRSEQGDVLYVIPFQELLDSCVDPQRT